MAASVPEGIPAHLAEGALDTLCGAVAAARQLPELGTVLLATARAAFTSGLRVTATVSALIVCGMAVLVVTSLRHARSPAEPDGGAASASPC